MAEEKRFLNYENSISIYRTKSALICGVLYFSKGYQSNPVIGLQFAEVNDPNAEQKTFNWDIENKVWYFPTYDKCWELVKKLSKWKQVLTNLRQQNLTDNDEISAKYKDFAEKQKISNPVRKKSLYLSVRYYNGYFFTMTLVGQNIKCSVSLYEEELDMLIKYLGDYITNYHLLTLQHRMVNILRGNSKGDSNSNGNGNGDYDQQESSSPPRNNRSSYTNNQAKPNDSFESKSRPATTKDAVDDLLQGGSLDDIMNSAGGANVDDDIPF